MRVSTAKMGAIHSIESRIAFMRNTCLRQNFMTKNWRKSNVLLIESIPQFFPSVIVIYLFLLSSINIDLLFSGYSVNVVYSSFLCKDQFVKFM